MRSTLCLSMFFFVMSAGCTTDAAPAPAPDVVACNGDHPAAPLCEIECADFSVGAHRIAGACTAHDASGAEHYCTESYDLDGAVGCCQPYGFEQQNPDGSIDRSSILVWWSCDDGQPTTMGGVQ